MSDSGYRTIDKCRVCGLHHLTSVLTLGDLYVSDFLDLPDNTRGTKAPLELVLCNTQDGGCGLLQLRHTVSSEAMYRNYWYRSGINKTMCDELNDIAKKARSVADLRSQDIVIDIGANDGTLLRGYKLPGLTTVGFEPARNLTQYNKEGTTKIIVDFFSHSAWQKEFGARKAKAITAIGMFYDLDDPNTFVSDLVKCLDDDGVLVIQMMYLPSFLARNAFDGICHEHLEYYSLGSLENLLRRHGLVVFDVEMREHINEGSARFYIKKERNGIELKVFNGAAGRMAALRAMEASMGLDDTEVYGALVSRILDAKHAVVSFIQQEVAKGKKVHGYAASTKGNTTLQFYGLTPDLVEAIADRNPDKWGKYAVGTLIPVISEEASRDEKPDYYFVLAWHFLSEFVQREDAFLRNGGKFIVPMPEFRIIGDELLRDDEK
jgi:hypothetical protein